MIKLKDLLNEEKPGLWANIRAKKARGEKPAHGNSDAHKDAVKAGKEINKEESVKEAKVKIPDYIVTSIPASNIPQTNISKADVGLGLAMGAEFGMYSTLNNKHYKLDYYNGKVALVLSKVGKLAVRVRTEKDPKYLAKIEKFVNDYLTKFAKNIKKTESVNEGLYFVGYNKGRGQGTGVFKDSYSSYKDAKKAVEKLEKERGGSYNMVAYYVADKDGKFVRESVTEAKAPYEVYHKSYTSAIEAAREYAEKKGFEIDNDDAFRKIGVGPRKPSEGKTNSFSIQLSKDGKLQRKQLHIQVYGMRNSYELNAYIG